MTGTRTPQPPQPAKFAHPPLTPQFCFSTKALKDFLRLSRTSIDDTISQHLNNLSVPSSVPWDPSSTSQLPHLPGSRTLPPSACSNFITSILFPAWQERSDVLNYCASVATSENPNDPDTLNTLASNAAEREKVVDERLDPYSGRYYPKETKTEILKGVVRNERSVEEIVRERTWGVVGERCEGVEEDWRRVLEEWRVGRV
ncbi:caffeine-induced death protein 2 [Pyronema domesticum]|uniref:Similar to Caffeine-induced death protein 2 acc. no. O74982 n=1 Tax=Pyronema omphalodes (strain CBS 100304) TaxID=1076935 RepID=U4LSE6_PYROM|nr:caffeine-induced death protein 2 [Pyronema domesticum]CCX34514.1 Similar to Caffeine-induced death protein 2; acc. no. O74982 [Pyronema omphalodes CBS 100304]